MRDIRKMRDIKIEEVSNGYLVTIDETSQKLSEPAFARNTFVFTSKKDLLDYLQTFLKEED